ncbi:MAG: thioredoxin domain-containing protein [Flavobacteriales bacterium]|nr:thioredoxin domain-containing protein [Flavobacteriales bacterium]
MHDHTNALIHETSPYLLQHAHNPVNWVPWGEEAFEKARAEDKLVLVSVGYSACHWCHVMEHETFEDSTAAAFMNEHFVCIKVDREERPDVDQVYMNAVQLMTQRGGWPLNCFTLPDGRPVYGGTYFPRENWMDVMKSLVEMKADDPAKMEDYASRLTEGVKQSEIIELAEDRELQASQVDRMVADWKSDWDRKKGGANRAPKFPLPNNYEFLMHYGWLHDDAETLDFVETTLTQMANGGIYDHLGGGFARYSTDPDWKVPHFEKMLYDNAQLVSLYAQAYAKYQNPQYRRVVEETIDFVNRELSGPQGEFYSALDADSEGKEGKFYVWSRAELDSLSAPTRAFVEAYYSINLRGEWEGNYILLRESTDDEVAQKLDIGIDELNVRREQAHGEMLGIRQMRTRPGLDDKTLTSWNALMISGLCDAYRHLGNPEFLARAEKNAQFIWNQQLTPDSSLWHSYKAGKSTINGYLEDYSFTIEAFVKLYQVTFDEQWLDRGRQLAFYCMDHFYDDRSGMFWFTSNIDPPLIARKQELMDNVIPASNSSMAKALFQLGTYYDNRAFLRASSQMLKNMLGEFQYGQNVSNWAILHLWHSYTVNEVAITGKGAAELRKEMEAMYLPHVFFMGNTDRSNLPLLQGKFLGTTTIFVCQNKSCQMPVEDIASALKQIRK